MEDLQKENSKPGSKECQLVYEASKTVIENLRRTLQEKSNISQTLYEYRCKNPK